MQPHPISKKDDMMDTLQLRYFLALWHIKGIGFSAFKKLVQKFPSLQDFFALQSMELKHLGCSDSMIAEIKNPNWRHVDAILQWREEPNHHLLTYLDPLYPSQLNEISGAPPLLFAKGQLELINYSQLAIVGSRNPTSTGKQTAKAFAAFLAKKGLIITSGMALGIDAMAHEGALSVPGKTIAVLGTGIDIVYPKSNQHLAAAIAEQGLLISEFSLGMKALAQHFPRRNRIISGLSLGIVVIEAAIKSGSLITARYALEQGRDVFALPSSVHNPMAKGCHWLIKQGAYLIETIEEIWQELQQHTLNLISNQIINTKAIDFCLDQPYIVPELTDEQQKLLNFIGFDKISVNFLLEQTNLSIEQLNVLLLELELLGQIEAVPGGYQKVVVKN